MALSRGLMLYLSNAPFTCFLQFQDIHFEVHLLSCIIQWDNSHHDPNINSVGQMFQGVLSTVFPEGSSVRQLPPSVIGIEAGSRGRFPLAMGHALHYVKPRIALIGFVSL